MKDLIFVSSVQKELADERRAIRDFVHGNRLLGKHFDVFLFEDLPAKSRRPDDLYLDEVEACSVFLALFGGSKRTAHRDLTDLVHKGLLERLGTTGKGTGNVPRKGATKGPSGPSAATRAKGAVKGSKGPSAPEPATKKGGKK